MNNLAWNCFPVRGLFIVLLTSLCAAGCNKLSLPTEKVDISVDWSECGEKPGKATLIMYPTNGNNPVTIVLSDADEGMADVPAGNYNVILFSGIMEDFSGIGFKGMEKYRTAEVFLKERKDSWYEASSGEVAYIPEMLSIAKLEDFTVSSNSVLELVPKQVTTTYEIKVPVEGIQNIRAIRGAMKGMNASFSFRDDKEEGKVVNLLEDWEVVKSSEKNGYVSVCIPSLGLSKLANPVQGDSTPLTVWFLLIDNKTIVKHKCGFSGGEETVFLQDVEREVSGFNPSIDDWEELTEVEVVLR